MPICHRVFVSAAAHVRAATSSRPSSLTKAVMVLVIKLLSAEYSLNGFQVAIAIFLLRLEDTAFGPFVPGVDSDDLRGGWGGQEAALDDLAGLTECGGGIGDHDWVHKGGGG